MKVWNFILSNLQNNIPVILLYVLESKGSSPGRKGFLMAVNANGDFEGTIGGGIMETKLIELSKAKMDKTNRETVVKKQYHDKKHARNQSGLICSGELTVAVLPLDKSGIDNIKEIVNAKKDIYVKIGSNSDFQIISSSDSLKEEKMIIRSESNFEATIKIPASKTIHIFGAGHVGLALARQMSILGYYIMQYDDRPNLTTLSQNEYASEIRIIDYANLKNELTFNPADIVVLVSFSYRSDKLLLQQLYRQSFSFIGMMGSDNKIATLKKELQDDGISEQEIEHVVMPIGVNIYSKTAEEIAVSIAAQIIFELNKDLPTGRKY